jgi:hypothetical protein
LDVGEGKDIDLEQCPRSKLEKELVNITFGILPLEYYLWNSPCFPIL